MVVSSRCENGPLRRRRTRGGSGVIGVLLGPEGVLGARGQSRSTGNKVASSSLREKSVPVNEIINFFLSVHVEASIVGQKIIKEALAEAVLAEISSDLRVIVLVIRSHLVL